MLDYPLDLIARVTEARAGSVPERRVRRVCTDSRQVQPGDLFIAIQGERFDGHQYVGDAFARGAAGALVGRERVPAAQAGAGPLLEVDDPLLALGELGRWHRNRFSVRLVGVTGSVGKTTTKDLVASVLSQQWKTLKSPASHNAELGLPLTLLQIDETHQAVVLEMAMRGRGQIRYLARLARPDVMVITNIGFSHLELLGSQQAIAETKGEALDYLPVGGTAILNADDAYHDFLRGLVPPGTDVCAFGMDRAERDFFSGTYLGPARVEGDEQQFGARFALRPARSSKVERVTLPVLGRHNVRNALAAAAVGQVMGISFPRICRGLQQADTGAMRMAVHRLRDGGVVLDDAYNASSPEAMLAAIEVLREMPGLRKIAVLGSMLELGHVTEEAHRKVGAGAAAISPTLLVTVGEAAGAIAEEAKHVGLAENTVVACADNAEALAVLRERRRAGDVVLVKGSRGMAMEQVVQGLLEQAG